MKNKTIFHAWDLGKLARSCKPLHLLCPTDLWNLRGTVLISEFESSQGSAEIHWVRQYLVKVDLFQMKDLQTSEMTVKLKSNLYVGPVNIFHWSGRHSKCNCLQNLTNFHRSRAWQIVPSVNTKIRYNITISLSRNIELSDLKLTKDTHILASEVKPSGVYCESLA